MNVSVDGADPAFFETVFRAATATLGQPDALAVGLTFVTEEEIRAANATYRAVDRVTDVLSFPSLTLSAGERVEPSAHPTDIDPETGDLWLGDILICDAVAGRQAAEYGHSLSRERAYLFLHALLHLFGYDHETDADRAAMREKEESILASIGLARSESC